MKNIWNISLRTKIILLALSVTAVGAAGAFHNLQRLIESNEEAHLVEFEAQAKQVSAGFAAQFYERYGDVQAFSKNESIRLMHLNRMQKDLNEYIPAYGVYDLILVLDKNGKLIGANQFDINQKPVNITALAAYNFAQSAWFQSALKGEFTENSSKVLTGTYFGDVELDSALQTAFGEERFGSTFATQIKDYEGNVVGVIATKANTRWYDSVIEDFYRTVQGDYPTTEFTLLNKKGQYIFHYNPAIIKDEKIQVEYDKNLVLKEKFYKEENDISKALSEQKTGSTYHSDPVDGNEDVVGYSFIKHPKWISEIGWSVLIHNEKAQVFDDVLRAKTNFYWITGLISLFILIFSSWAGIKLSKSVELITENLAVNTKQLDEASVNIAAGATQLSESATEQASALQETVSTIDEISSMIQKNSDAAQKSKELSAQSKNSTEQGRQTIDSMMMAIDEIELNNTEVSSQMTQTNMQLSEITKMIHNISSKTKVINEIVFQTKLLSFNASVEAARAGEYGKGFAVVAEEVGKLAQMSGGAAKDISEMLQESVTKVEFIIQDTRGKVDKLMHQSKEKVNFGSETAKQCKQALSEIAQSVNSVDQLVSEIAVASKEQSAGVVQISQAINQLEVVTNQNSAVAQSSSVSAERLREQAGSLSQVVESLALYVNGNKEVNSKSSKDEAMFEKTSAPLKTFVPPYVPSKTTNKLATTASKVLAFEPKKSAPSFSKTQNYQTVLKNASGYDAKVPSADDPGFSEE
ncbi:MAG: methyl-accepting chemotaxis protein [Pseudobdellovibrio sp.]